MGLGGQKHTLVALPWDILQEGSSVPEAALMNAENLDPRGMGTQLFQPIACRYTD